MWNLIKKDLKILGQYKKIWMLLLAVLIIFIIGTAFYAAEDPAQSKAGVSIGIIDFDQSEYSNLLISYFKDNEVFSNYVQILVGEEEEIKNKFTQGDLTMYLVIPPNFAQSLITIENIPMKAVIQQEDTTKAIILKNMLLSYEKYISAVELNCVALYDKMEEAEMPESLVNSENVRISYDLVFTALGRNTFFDYVEQKELAGIPIRTYYTYEIVYLLLAYLAVLVGMDFLLERKRGILSRLVTTGTKITHVIVAKLCVYTSGVLVLGVFLSMLGKSGYFPTLTLSEVIFIVLCFGLMELSFILFGTLLKKVPNYLLFSNSLVIFSAILGAGLIPKLYLPEIMQNFAKVSPNYWFLTTTFSYHLQEKSISLGVIVGLLFTMLLLVVSIGYLYRWKEGVIHEEI